MASYQIRQREPLLDKATQATLERRGKELLGLGMIGLGVVFALLLASYSPEDPGWMAATDAPAENILGRFGAWVASPLNVIAGVGAWGLAVGFAVWGGRLVLHQGEERALGRMTLLPIGVAVAAVFAATHVPNADWPHAFGMGGLFGDTVLGALLGVLPMSPGAGLRLLSVLMGAGTLGFGLFVLGFDRSELRAMARFLVLGLIVLYDGLVRLMGRGANHALSRAQAHAVERRERRHASFEPSHDLGAASQTVQERIRQIAADRRQPPVLTDPELIEDETGAETAGACGFLSRMPDLIRRAVPMAAAPVRTEFMAEPVLTRAQASDTSASQDRIRGRISDAIAARARPEPTLGRIAPREGAPHDDFDTADDGHNASDLMAFDATEEANYADHLDAEHMDDIALQAPDVFALRPDDEDTPDLPVAHAAAAPREAQSDTRKVVMPTTKRPAPSRRAQAEAQPRLRLGDDGAQDYEHPPLSLLTSPVEIKRHHLSDEALEENARMLETVLDDYGVKGEIVSVRPGPVVTMYELEPAPGLKASRVIGLSDDIARSMSALSARVSTVPGRTVIGIELPNVFREKVVLREILSARGFGDSNMRLPLALGKDIGGEPIVANLAKMPHLLIAGTTGSGKSVAINTMILSLLYKLSPEECRMIMIDPKMLELSVYDGIPHLLSPVVTDPKKAVVALKWVVGEMEERYRKMSKMGVRNIDGYNGRVREALDNGEMFKRTIQTGFDEETGEPVFETEEFAPVALPFIVVIVDEMADLMMVAGKEIEACIQRLAQMARASGIHLIMATQRPSVDVITGTIKANFPTRISFQVTSKIDSRTILGEMGAEQLLGMGDMLYMAGGAKITRIHGPFVSDEEVEEVVNHLKSFGPPEYMSNVTEGGDEDRESDIDIVLGLGGGDGEDALYDQAVGVVIKDRKCSTSYIQRKLGIGYNKAARLVEQMEDQGVVSTANHVGKREVLVPEQ